MFRYLKPTLFATALLVALPSRAIADDRFARRANEQLASIREIAARLPTARTEQAMLADAADGSWNKFDLLSAAVVAQVASPKERQRFAAKLERHATHVRQLLAANPEQPAAETLFTYLHTHVLTGRFSADCHSIARALSSGNYNCLSGTILFIGLAERCGVPANAVLAPTHVFVRANVRGSEQDIETTVPSWFRETVASREQRLAAALGNSVASHRRDISSTELLAVVYYNRGVEAFARRDFAAATASNLVALRLDNDNASARDNLLAAINNWAIQSAKRGDTALAKKLLSRGRNLAPDRNDLKATERFVKESSATSVKEEIAAGRPVFKP
jgi:tetratricopeptide (TPR) repeat protein